jgi:hypothetical protein
MASRTSGLHDRSESPIFKSEPLGAIAVKVYGSFPMIPGMARTESAATRRHITLPAADVMFKVIFACVHKAGRSQSRLRSSMSLPTPGKRKPFRPERSPAHRCMPYPLQLTGLAEALRSLGEVPGGILEERP